jgi:hypothetical protein
MIPQKQSVGAPAGRDREIRWPVWSGSVQKPVGFQPMPKREALRIWHDLRRFERQTRQPGRQDGAVGRNGLAVAHALLFDFLDYRTGQLTPTRASIARAANICVRSVDRGLARLKACGALDWKRRCEQALENGVFRLEQIASAYFVQAQSAWLGFWRPAECPGPWPEAWGAAPPLPDPLAAAAAAHAGGASLEAQIAALESDPRDALANALGRLGRLVGLGKR